MSDKFKESGAVLVTLAYSLPLAGIVLFVLLAIAYYINTRTTLEEAVTMGVRAASTRGKVGALWREHDTQALLNRIDDDNNFPEFFVHNAPMGDHMGTYSTLTKFWGGIALTDSQNIYNLPRPYRYALAMTLRSVRSSLGDEMVRYPCGVGADGLLVNSEFSNTPGCLICYPVRHSFEGDQCGIPNGCTNCDGNRCLSFNHIPLNRLSRSFVSIACRHNPRDLFLRPLVGLFGALGINFQQELFIYASDFQDKSSGLLVDWE